jgi:hypothetical protein
VWPLVDQNRKPAIRFKSYQGAIYTKNTQTNKLPDQVKGRRPTGVSLRKKNYVSGTPTPHIVTLSFPKLNCFISGGVSCRMIYVGTLKASGLQFDAVKTPDQSVVSPWQLLTSLILLTTETGGLDSFFMVRGLHADLGFSQAFWILTGSGRGDQGAFRMTWCVEKRRFSYISHFPFTYITPTPKININITWTPLFCMEWWYFARDGMRDWKSAWAFSTHPHTCHNIHLSSTTQYRSCIFSFVACVSASDGDWSFRRRWPMVLRATLVVSPLFSYESSPLFLGWMRLQQAHQNPHT